MEKDFEREVIERLTKLETLITQQDYSQIKKTSDEANQRSLNNEEKIKSLEDNLKWIVRLVLGAVILGILAFVYKM
jgi:superfamily I DNA and/or RNA helicase